MADLVRIQQFVQQGQYRVKVHTLQHMMEEGFEESHIVEAVMGGEVLEDYPDENRCLILGTFHWTTKTISPLHIVCDYSQRDRVEFVTAYIPRRPAWITARQRGRKKQ
jgi:hypothetical protein